MKIPLVDVYAQNSALSNEINIAIGAVIGSSTFIGGDAVEKFEKSFAQRHGGGHVIGVGSGSDALNLALKSLGLKPGDEVITVPNTWISTVFAISHSGATPVFADINPETYQVDMEQLEKRITPSTKAVVAVHMFGHPAPMNEIMALCRPKGIRVIEDVAQAVDAELGRRKVGTFGDIACFSFYPGKNLGCLGDGGAVLTKHRDLADFIRALARYGQPEKFNHKHIGWNSRLDAIQAAVLEVKLPYLKEWTEARRQHAKSYQDLLQGIKLNLPRESSGARHVYHLYVIETAKRDQVLHSLRNRGVMAQVHYPAGVHLQECYRTLGYAKGDFPVAERAANRILSIPMFAELTTEQMEYTAHALKDILGDIL
ncbi:MAG: hypothetical protein CBD27_10795 [Rhodospirillaceae bacterium TMED167]|nr:erythromycin biosynthesis sensory transduction protein eryC1 [Rhodospirillaceae bacterium]OUW24789.1 MAG: hypothetical protein CBD27_10795 [Rhodospirillaceae bacterium TMED167]|tara:strand:+ start:436 stop:1545 length:1110 start_codon:yes stop_codon:yes gene_type:complete